MTTLPFVITPEPPPHPKKEDIQVSFLEFHANNPQVYDWLVYLSRQGKARGRRKLGMKQFFEVLRWEVHIEGLPDDREIFKLRNSYTSRYARLIMEQEPDLENMFEVRKLKSP